MLLMVPVDGCIFGTGSAHTQAIDKPDQMAINEDRRNTD